MQLSRKALFGLLLVGITIASGIYEGYVWHRNRVIADVRGVLSSLSPVGRATYQTLEYSIFSDILILNGVELISGEEMFPSLKVDRLVVGKPSYTNIRRIFSDEKADILATLSLADFVVAEGIRWYQKGPYEVTLDRIEVSHLQARPSDYDRIDGFFTFLEAIQFHTVTLDNFEIRTFRDVQPQDGAWYSYLSPGYIYTTRIDQAVLTDMNKKTLNALFLNGISISIEKNTYELFSEKTDLFQEKTMIALKKAFFKGIDAESFRYLGKTWSRKEEAVLLSLQRLVGESFGFEGLTVTEERFLSPTSDGVPHKKELDVNVAALAMNGLENGALETVRLDGVAVQSVVYTGTEPVVQLQYRQKSMLMEEIDIIPLVQPFIRMQTAPFHKNLLGDMAMAIALERFVSPPLPGKMKVQDIYLSTPALGGVSLEELIGVAVYRDDTLVASELFFKGGQWVPSEKEHFLTTAGYSNFLVSGRLRGNFSIADDRYRLFVDVNVRDAGKLNLTVELGNYPRRQRGSYEVDDMIDTEESELQWIKERLGWTRLHKMVLLYADDTLLKRVLSYIAKKQRVSPDDVRRKVGDFLNAMLKSDHIQKSGMASEFEISANAVQRFLQKSGSITLSLKPEKPVLLNTMTELSLEEILVLLNAAAMHGYVGDKP